MLMLITLGVGIAMWGDYLAVIVVLDGLALFVVLGGLALFVVLGNLRARRSPRK
jgi:hypothetical protein